MSPTERQRTVDHLVEALRPVVAHAENVGVKLGIEPLSRYEQFDQYCCPGLEMVKSADSPACGVALPWIRFT